MLMLFLLGFTQVYAVETEPNDVKNDATKLTLNAADTGDIGVANDVDWWKVTTNKDGALNLTLTISNSLYAYFQLYDKNGTTLLKSDYTNSSNTIIQDGLSPGTYFIKIYAYTAGQLPAYTIANDLDIAPLANDPEPNGSYTEANPLMPDGSVTGHCGYYYNESRDSTDWWSITTTGNGKLSLTLDIENSQYLYWKLYDGDGMTVLGTNYTNSSDVLVVDGLAAGTYYVNVYGYFSYNFAPYTLTSVFTAPPVANDVEPDDTKSNANNIPLNGMKTGQVGYAYNGDRDDTDWFKFTTNGDGRVRLTMTSYNGQFVYWQMYDKDGTTSLHNGYTNGTDYYDVDGLAAGKYYVKVYTYYSNGFVSYALSDSLFEPAIANDAEPNDGKFQALDLAFEDTVTGHVGYYYDGQRDEVDWYKFTTPDDGEVTVTITSDNGQFIYFQLFDDDAVTLIKSDYTNGTKTHLTDGLAAGTYYIKVFCYYSTGYTPYILTNGLNLYAYGNDGINNDIPEKAATVPVDEGVTGHVGFRYNGGEKDPRDWWKINYTGKGNMTITLNWETTLCCGTKFVYLKVYSDTAMSPVYNQYSNSGTLVADFTDLPKQYYYVQVVTYYGSDWSAYELIPSFTQKEKAKITILSAAAGTDCTNGAIEFKCGKSEPPYSVQLFRMGKKYGEPFVVKKKKPFTLDTLSPGNYYANVYGDGATGQGKGTSETVTIVPVPINTVTKSIKFDRATLKWNPLDCIDFDSIYYRIAGTSTWIKTETGNNSGKYKLKNLDPSTTYEWKVANVVAAFGEMATGAYSSIETFTTKAMKASNITANKKRTLSLFPNPAEATTTLQGYNETAGAVQVCIIDAAGRIIQMENLPTIQGIFSYEMNTASFSQGIYLVRVTINGNDETIRLVKQ